jgi:transposase
LGDLPLVLDREFSYEEMYKAASEEGVRYVVRLNTGNRAAIADEEGNKLSLALSPGEKVFLKGVFYKGKVKGNLAGEWHKGFKEPLWVFSDLEPGEALEVYQARMKIEEAFKDLKSLLGLERIMNKKQENMEKMIAFLLLAYAVGLLTGEALREEIYSGEKTEALFRSIYFAEASSKDSSAGTFKVTGKGLGNV